MGVATAHCPVLPLSLALSCTSSRSFRLAPFLSSFSLCLSCPFAFFSISILLPLSFSLHAFFSRRCSLSSFLSVPVSSHFCPSSLSFSLSLFRPLASVRELFRAIFSFSVAREKHRSLSRSRLLAGPSILSLHAAISIASSIMARTPALSRGSPHWRVDGGQGDEGAFSQFGGVRQRSW